MPLKVNPPSTLKKQQEYSLTIGKNLREQKKEFVQDALKHTPVEASSKEESNDQKKYPWNASLVREDMTKLFNIRLSEPDWLKLKYISDQTNESMHSICLDVLVPAIYRRLKKLLEKQIV